jgi:UDP-N-acetylglucosamine 1-carboxyvinyltransferase
MRRRVDVARRCTDTFDMARTYVVTGGSPLHGTVLVKGAKNAVTKMIVASLLSPEPIYLRNVPRIGEVDMTLEMVRSLGTQVTWDGESSVHLSSGNVMTAHVSQTYSGKNRIPVLLAAPLLHRLGHAEIPVLGGDDIGARPIDFHLEGYKAMGAQVEYKDDLVVFSAKKLKGAVVTLPYPSVMATENLLLAAVLAEGTTVIKNVAVEPEIMDLLDLLQKMGAIIFHEPGRVFVVEGVPWLSGTEHTVLPDRIEAASFACTAIATRGSVFVQGAVQRDLQTFLNVLRKIGGKFDVRDDGIRFFHEGELRATTIETGVHPGFMTDWHPPFAILLTQAAGTSVIHETVHEHRLGYTAALKTMGADVELFSKCLGGSECRFRDRDFKHSAIIRGPTKLSAADVEVPDLRAGFAYLIAALVANGGMSRIAGAEKLDRGYENLVSHLQALGANIQVEA